MSDPPVPPRRERRLRVVRDDERAPAPDDRPADPPTLTSPDPAPTAPARPGPPPRSGPPEPAAHAPAAGALAAPAPFVRPAPVPVPRSVAVAPGPVDFARDGPPADGPGVVRRWGRVRALGMVWSLVGLGTAAAVGVDAWVGPVDGRPAVFLLVLFLLPFWDRLPARISARLAVLAAVTAAVAAGWYALAALHDAGWWPAAAFGLACGVAGTVPVVLGRPRTVER